MKKFILDLGLFFTTVFTILFVGMFIPATPRSKSSLLFSKIDKDSLLTNVKNPRIILVGGSNLSLGINSQMLKDSLGLNPINTGIQASLGLQYMLNETLPLINKGDVVVVSPEYHNFYSSFAYGNEVLCRMFFDVQLPNRKDSFMEEFTKLSYKQWSNILQYYPKYVASKFSVFEYLQIKKDLVYSRDSYNDYGDVFTHFNLPQEKYLDLDTIFGDFNYEIMEEMKLFEKKLIKKGAKMFVTFPSMEEHSIHNTKTQINLIYLKLIKNKFAVLGDPFLFEIKRNYTFNGSVHLNKEGMNKRTDLLIKELKKVL